MSDEQYLINYPVTTEDVEEWLTAYWELLTGESTDGYQPRHGWLTTFTGWIFIGDDPDGE